MSDVRTETPDRVLRGRRDCGNCGRELVSGTLVRVKGASPYVCPYCFAEVPSRGLEITCQGCGGEDLTISAGISGTDADGTDIGVSISCDGCGESYQSSVQSGRVLQDVHEGLHAKVEEGSPEVEEASEGVSLELRVRRIEAELEKTRGWVMSIDEVAVREGWDMLSGSISPARKKRGRVLRCERCGVAFEVGFGTGRRSTSKFCSNACRVAAFKARHAGRKRDGELKG